MELLEIFKRIEDNHKNLIRYIQSLNQEVFEKNIEGKWTPGQHLEHLYLSIKPLNSGLLTPVFILKLIFGKTKRQSYSYDELIALYKKSIDEGGKASKNYIPSPVPYSQKDEIIEKLESTLNSFLMRLRDMKEEDINTILLPHPLIGKITFREMLYFTIYHPEHHHKIIQRDLANS